MILPNEFALMDKLALEFLMDYEIYSFPLDVFKIASEILNAELIPYSSLTDKQLTYIRSKEALDKGYTITERLSNGDKRYKIYYNDSDNLYRQRFTISHEIKHILLGEENFSNDSEILADYFAKALQAPKCMLISFPLDSQEECVLKYSLSYEASGYWLDTINKRIKAVGEDLFDYERKYMDMYLKFNKTKKD